LWNKEIIALSEGEPCYNDPKVVYRYAKDGVGISVIKEWYLVNNSPIYADGDWSTEF
jgi:hypothetical protein